MKEEISSKQAAALILAFILDGAIIFPTAIEAQRNSWISVIIALGAAYILFMLYYKIQLIYEGEDLYSINEKVMGRILGKVINILYVWYFLHLGALTLRDFGEFMNTLTMPETPRMAIIILSALTAVYMVKKGCEIIAEFSLFATVITLLTMGILITLLISKINIYNVLPIMAQGIKPVLLGTWSTLTFPFGECILFITVFSKIKNKKALKKGYFLGLTLGGVLLVINSFFQVSILGEKILGFLYFPFYTLLSRIKVGEFIQRLEIIGGVILNVFGMIKISLCLYATSLGISNMFKINNYKILCLPVGLVMLNLSNILYEDIMSLVSWTAKYYKYYALPFQLFFPLLIFIVSKIRNRVP
ncbi:endospore germination permease [Clostridium sp. CX1]|uniref:GerAB/ArcD/ProY family transporter n=1 Tax=Clostridium sp. CX1 TaxID=2978346 RepID=UPI0021C1D64D|nr:endospore germination permease [Clostridium sp. CX1]MCT8977958.1 endospore germination permease [Clostridium sp. CX1]